MSDYEPSMQSSSRPGLTFFDLPRELRDYCYDLALTAPTPIIAWSGIRPENSESLKPEIEFKYDLETGRHFRATTADMRITTRNALQCHSIIAHEAAAIFYGKNKFVFGGDWTWETVTNWFRNIGPRNRSLVTSIELWQHQPSHAWQITSGERIDVVEFEFKPLEPPFPRNRHLHQSPNMTPEGLVDNINPAIETFFQLIGNKRATKLLLTFSLRMSLIPGIEINYDDEVAHRNWFSMDLPNIVEKLRTTDTNGCVDVVWKGDVLRQTFLEKREDIEARWRILDREEYEHTHPRRKERTWRCLRFSMERKELPGPLLAENPSPYSHWGWYTVQGTLRNSVDQGR